MLGQVFHRAAPVFHVNHYNKNQPSNVKSRLHFDKLNFTLTMASASYLTSHGEDGRLLYVKEKADSASTLPALVANNRSPATPQAKWDPTR
jgi:hypothetical protein